MPCPSKRPRLKNPRPSLAQELHPGSTAAALLTAPSFGTSRPRLCGMVDLLPCPLLLKLRRKSQHLRREANGRRLARRSRHVIRRLCDSVGNGNAGRPVPPQLKARRRRCQCLCREAKGVPRPSRRPRLKTPRPSLAQGLYPGSTAAALPTAPSFGTSRSRLCGTVSLLPCRLLRLHYGATADGREMVRCPQPHGRNTTRPRRVPPSILRLRTILRSHLSDTPQRLPRPSHTGHILTENKVAMARTGQERIVILNALRCSAEAVQVRLSGCSPEGA